jgi:hypothetical protein
MIVKIAAAVALLGMLTGCAGWAPNMQEENPAIYEQSLSD